MKTFALFFRKTFSALSTLLMIIMLGLLALYSWEKTRPVSDYYTYYGNVTTQQRFTFPERIASYTFGTSNNTIPMSFVNQLWCSPIDSTKPRDLIATRFKYFDSYGFQNELPNITTRPIDDENRLSQIGASDRELIRNQNAEADGRRYLSWDMGEIFPDEDSDCYVTAEATTYTKFFNIPKSLTFSGNEFEYVILQETGE